MKLKAESRKHKAFRINGCHAEREASGTLRNHHNGDFANVRCFVTQHDKKGFELTNSFLLSAFWFLLSAFCSSCSFNPNMQGKGETYIQGIWQQDSSAVQQKLVTSSRYSMRFDCDSFFVKMDNRSAVNYGSDSCMKSGHWAEYLRGTYHQRHDTLFLKGEFANADFTIKTKLDCFHAGPYQEFFKVAKQTDSLIQLSGTSSVIPIQLHRTKKTSCILKPL